jgi:hypothetical protein
MRLFTKLRATGVFVCGVHVAFDARYPDSEWRQLDD